MEVHLTQRFERAYGRLTAAEKRSVVKALTLLGDNPRHPGLRVKKMGGTKNVWEARPSARLRMTFEVTGQAILMRNVGEHDSALKRR